MLLQKQKIGAIQCSDDRSYSLRLACQAMLKLCYTKLSLGIFTRIICVADHFHEDMDI